MKKRNLLLMLFAGACVSLATFAVRAQVTIMPFGDSITTYGSAPQSSYRYWLYADLTNAGYVWNQDFVFVGTSSGVENGSPAISWPAEQFSGHLGWTTADALGDNDAFGINPQIVLLEFGSNDILDNFPLGETETNLEDIVQTFYNENPSVVILIAEPTGFAVDPTLPIASQKELRREQSQLVGIVSRVAKTERKAGVDIGTVNLFNGYNTRTDTIDGTHPDVRGEQQIAKKFYNALRPVLKKMGVEPVPKRDR